MASATYGGGLLTQGELFGREMSIRRETNPPAAPAHTVGRSALTRPDELPEPQRDSARGAKAAEQELHKKVQDRLGLWIDPFTAAYVLRALARGEQEIEFIAADARSGRSAFHVVAAEKLRSA